MRSRIGIKIGILIKCSELVVRFTTKSELKRKYLFLHSTAYNLISYLPTIDKWSTTDFASYRLSFSRLFFNILTKILPSKNVPFSQYMENNVFSTFQSIKLQNFCVTLSVTNVKPEVPVNVSV